MRVEINISLLIFCCFVRSFSAQEIDEEFKLPNTTKPENYDVVITTNMLTDTKEFSGVVFIKIKVLETTREVFLHSRNHTIEEVFLVSNMTKYDRQTDDV